VRLRPLGLVEQHGDCEILTVHARPEDGRYAVHRLDLDAVAAEKSVTPIGENRARLAAEANLRKLLQLLPCAVRNWLFETFGGAFIYPTSRSISAPPPTRWRYEQRLFQGRLQEPQQEHRHSDCDYVSGDDQPSMAVDVFVELLEPAHTADHATHAIKPAQLVVGGGRIALESESRIRCVGVQLIQLTDGIVVGHARPLQLREALGHFPSDDIRMRRALVTDAQHRGVRRATAGVDEAAEEQQVPVVVFAAETVDIAQHAWRETIEEDIIFEDQDGAGARGKPPPQARLMGLEDALLGVAGMLGDGDEFGAIMQADAGELTAGLVQTIRPVDETDAVDAINEPPEVDIVGALRASGLWVRGSGGGYRKA